MLSAITTVLAAILVLVLILWCWFQWKYRAFIQVASKIPVPDETPKLPVIGHAHLTVSGLTGVTWNLLHMALHGVSNSSKMACFWCGPLPIVQIFGAEDIQKVLNSSITCQKGEEMDYAKYAGGNGLVLASHDIWKITRRYISPLFHPQNIEKLVPTFNKNSREMVANLSEHVGTGPVDVYHLTVKIALKSVSNLTFGPDVEFDIKSEGFQNYPKAMELVTQLFMKRVFYFWLRNGTIFRFVYKKDLAYIEEALNTIVDAPLKETRENNKAKESIVKELSEKDPGGIHASESQDPLNLPEVFSKLMQHYPQFTEKDLIYEIRTMQGVGTDTIAGAISSCVLLLSHHQDVQERLYQEISSVVGQDDDVTTEDLNRMPYLDQVYKETLRWSNLIPYVLRKTADDLSLSSCTIPAGNTVAVGFFGLHMDPEIYPEPLKFNPDRFSEKNMAGKDRYTFLPYSGGARNCIGKLYAKIMMKITVVHILRSFKLSTHQDVYNMKRKLLVTLVSAEGYNIILQHRT